jgi:hypothetical protein
MYKTSCSKSPDTYGVVRSYLNKNSEKSNETQIINAK